MITENNQKSAPAKTKHPLFALALAIALAFGSSGCLSSTYHLTGEFDFPYNATTDCWNNCLGAWWREPKDEIENAMDAYSKLVYPFWVVDFPLEVVMDTVLFPADEIVYLCQDKPKK